MKKKLSALLCALCMAMALCLTAFAAGNPTISGTAARDGSKVTLTLALNTAGAEITALQFDVHFDTEKLEYDRASNVRGNLEGISFTGGADKGGYVTVLGDVGLGDPVAVNGTMVTLAFNVKEGATGDAAFTIDNVKGKINTDDVAVDVAKIDAIAVADPEPTVYNVNVTEPAEGGKVSVDKTTATAGETVAVTATPDTDYELDKIIVKAGDTQVDVKADGTFEMPASDVNVTATFKKVETPVTPAPVYNITVAPYENGKVSVDKTTAKAGETVTVTATPDDGYVAKISVTTKSGATVAVKDAKFTMPAEDVTVTVNFTEKATKPSEKPSTSPSTNPSTSPSTKPSTTNKPSNKTTTVTATATPAPTAQPKPAAAIPQTGDTANLALYAVLCVASAMALGYVVYRKKANH